MVWNQNSEYIATLCGINEEGRIKCDIYFPDPELSGGNEMRIGNNFHLKLEKIDKTDPFYWIRTITVSNLKTGESRVVYQYHVEIFYIEF